MAPDRRSRSLPAGGQLPSPSNDDGVVVYAVVRERWIDGDSARRAGACMYPMGMGSMTDQSPAACNLAIDPCVWWTFALERIPIDHASKSIHPFRWERHGDRDGMNFNPDSDELQLLQVSAARTNSRHTHAHTHTYICYLPSVSIGLKFFRFLLTVH